MIMRPDHIRALTGIRFFAALWVVAYHSTRHNAEILAAHNPRLLDVVEPLTRQGLRGVDLFFMLSGFVLTLNYLDEVGSRFDVARAGRFLALRIARVWPLYVFVLVLSGVLIAVRHVLWQSVSLSRLTFAHFLEQLLMVQIWTRSQTPGSSWSGPAWSLSAEWLAYLLFPVLALALLPIQRRLRARSLFAAALVAILPLLLLGVRFHGLWFERSWLLRIGCEFVAGMLLCAGISRLRLTQLERRLAGALAPALIALLVGWYYVTFYLFDPWLGLLGIVVFLPLIGALAVGTGTFAGFLSTKVLVLGGGISYALYLLHSPMLYLFRDATTYSRIHLDPVPRYYAELLWIPLIVLAAWAAYRFVEEPARGFIRRRLDQQCRATEKPLIPADHRSSDQDPGLALLPDSPVPPPLAGLPATGPGAARPARKDSASGSARPLR
jgi:peptidoglycan/LPS O-acetylase OafA/YrhL